MSKFGPARTPQARPDNIFGIPDVTKLDDAATELAALREYLRERHAEGLDLPLAEFRKQYTAWYERRGKMLTMAAFARHLRLAGIQAEPERVLGTGVRRRRLKMSAEELAAL
eukprot:m.265587 g.265587  ORF g.265587 m.265587 type:complete len:112 (-) comp11062_c1_seq6:47-382(-)